MECRLESGIQGGLPVYKVVGTVVFCRGSKAPFLPERERKEAFARGCLSQANEANTHDELWSKRQGHKYRTRDAKRLRGVSQGPK